MQNQCWVFVVWFRWGNSCTTGWKTEWWMLEFTSIIKIIIIIHLMEQWNVKHNRCDKMVFNEMHFVGVVADMILICQNRFCLKTEKRLRLSISCCFFLFIFFSYLRFGFWLWLFSFFYRFVCYHVIPQRLGENFNKLDIHLLNMKI